MSAFNESLLNVNHAQDTVVDTGDIISGADPAVNKAATISA